MEVPVGLVEAGHDLAVHNKLVMAAMASQDKAHEAGYAASDSAPAPAPGGVVPDSPSSSSDGEKTSASATSAAGPPNTTTTGGGGGNFLPGRRSSRWSDKMGPRPACFRGAAHEALFAAIVAPAAIGAASMLTGAVSVVTAAIGRDLGMTQGQIPWISAASS